MLKSRSKKVEREWEVRASSLPLALDIVASKSGNDARTIGIFDATMKPVVASIEQ
jgi:hypothetical protein